jgi:CheY-like chemotaxis protein
MIIDDQSRNLLLLEQILEDMFADIDIVKADSGEKAIAAARDQEFDLILTDISLPGMDGIQITKELKTLPQYKDTPFIAVTAHAALKDEELFRSIFDDYIFKPIEEDIFAQKIEKWIGVL